MGTLSRRARRHALSLGALAPTVVVAGAPSDAAIGDAVSAPTEVHCISRALRLDEAKSGTTANVKCFDTFAEALQSIGISVDPAMDPVQYAAITRSRGVGASESFPYDVLAIHYRPGASLSVYGTACNGGGIADLGAYGWNDAINQTQNFRCGNVKHFRDVNYGDYAGSTTGTYTPPQVAPGSPYISSLAYFA